MNDDTPERFERSVAVRKWYADHARAFLAEFTPERTHEFDRDVARIAALEKQVGEERAVCFVGHSGVGKSTLINALVTNRQTVLPQGGIGPLTAQATCVRWAEKPYFRATYLPAVKLNRLVFGLDRHQECRQGGGIRDAAAPSAGDLELDSEDREEALADAADDEASVRIEALLRQARLMVRGSPTTEAEVSYLADCLRAALGRPARHGHVPTTEDAERIESLQQALALAKNGEARNEQGEFSDPAFRRALRDHASGHLAPLIKTLEVGWDSPVLLSGLTLVDLPGLGIANDEYRNVTQSWVRNEAKAIALVVDRAGVTQDSADLLRSSGFFGRLLHAADDPSADPVQLLVIGVKLDLTADDEWRDERSIDPDNARPWPEHFASVQERMRETLRAQVREQIFAALRQASSEEAREDIDRVLSRLMGDLSIHTVSAPEFRKLAVGDEEDRARIREASQSGIPQLRKELEQLATQHAELLDKRILAASDQLAERVRGSLEVVRSQWEEGERPLEEVERLRTELESFLAGPSGPRRELHSRQGAFREFLSETIPERIRDLVEEARQTAEREIRDYLADLRDAHWATLRAAVRRGGTYLQGVSRQVDIPSDFAVRIDEPIGLIWSKRILATVRKRTTDLATDYIGLVQRVTEWASEQGTHVRPQKLKALENEMRADARALNTVGKEKVEDLREAVRQQLLQRIKGPIRKRCKDFVEAGLDQGSGTKRRILDLFDDLVPEVVEAAKPTATNVLLSNFQAVEVEIREVFDKYADPLERASEAIVSSEETRLRRQDACRQGEVLKRIDAIVSAAPGLSVREATA